MPVKVQDSFQMGGYSTYAQSLKAYIPQNSTFCLSEWEVAPLSSQTPIPHSYAYTDVWLSSNSRQGAQKVEPGFFSLNAF